ncbi:MAG: hypothetical protein QM730_09730 [Anaerolineales bacterium]
MSWNTPSTKAASEIGAHEGRVGFPPDEHDHGIEDDGFARTGLAGENDQTGTEAQVEFIYDRKVMDS